MVMVTSGIGGFRRSIVVPYGAVMRFQTSGSSSSTKISIGINNLAIHGTNIRIRGASRGILFP